MKTILFVGSGNSSKLVKELDKGPFGIDRFGVVALNNAYRHFEDSRLGCWLHSGDFPAEWRPKDISFIHKEVSHPDYENEVIDIVTNTLKVKTASPAHYVGYTMFFQGLYYIANKFKPDRILLLGFDHDYDPEKVKIWKDEGQPNPQNNFKVKGGETIKDSLNKTFKDNNKDSFYGHGTPDPLRLGEDHLISKMELAKKHFKELNIELYNLSPIVSEINTIEKLSIDEL